MKNGMLIILFVTINIAFKNRVPGKYIQAWKFIHVPTSLYKNFHLKEIDKV